MDCTNQTDVTLPLTSPTISDIFLLVTSAAIESQIDSLEDYINDSATTTDACDDEWANDHVSDAQLAGLLCQPSVGLYSCS